MEKKEIYEYSIHCSQERFELEYGYPEGVEITHIPYNGNPFSAYTIIKKENKCIYVQFGAGEYYPDEVFNFIKAYLG